jgi:GH25 family lysozyme M1 (1,4-beta-N-acetylmuramidase)
MFTLLIDSSTYQDNSQTVQRIDWTKPAQHGVKGVINRALFVTAQDEDFAHNWGEQRGRYARGAYGFWGYWSGCAPVTEQAHKLVSILKPDPGEMPVVWLDIEKANDNYDPLPVRAKALPEIERYMKTVEDGLGKACGMYTNIAGLHTLAPIPGWLLEKPLWIAWPLAPSTGETPEQFIARTGVRPPLAKYWTGPFTIWQYSWHGPGLAMGMESKGLDMDYFNGNEAAFSHWCGASLPDEPEVNMYKDKAIGLVTDKPGWTNPDFDFVIAEAVRSWLKPNEQLKPIEEQCAAAGIPMLARVRFSVDYYVRNQYPMDAKLWPPSERDEPLQMAIRALANRSVYGVIVDITDHRDHDAKPQDPNYLSFAAKIFVERLAGWMKVRKPYTMLFVGTSNSFIEQHSPDMNNWAHKYPSLIVQEPPFPLAALDNSFPPAGEKPAHISIRATWELWQYRPTLAIASTDRDGLYDAIGYGAVTPPPDEPPPPPPPQAGDIEKLYAELAALREAFANHTHGKPLA